MENFHSEIEQDSRRQKDPSWSWVGKINVKMSTLPKESMDAI